ncbi:MAG TPA: organomercurial lyase MerB [Acidimicrobiales bacterium]|nr:organomercurial lyase MerB [Acidimicrobiales bacterium]
MTESRACSDARFISRVEGIEAFPHLVRLLARGTPIGMEQLAALAGRPEGEVDRLLRSQPGTDWDEHGRLVGFGLTLRPTQTRYTVNGHTFYTWCATDTLLCTLIIGQPAVVESTCPVTGQPIRLKLRPDAIVSVDPAGAVVSHPRRGEPVADLRAELCDHGHFFASPAAANTWATEHPEGQVLTVAEAFEDCRQTFHELGWSASKEAPR